MNVLKFYNNNHIIKKILSLISYPSDSICNNLQMLVYVNGEVDNDNGAKVFLC